MTRSDQAFWSLRDASLEFTPEQWDAYYPSMARWLLHDSSEIRACAMERLCMAVFWAERHIGDWPPHINLWMLDLLERRKGSAPKNALFNDIDFYLHASAWQACMRCLENRHLKKEQAPSC